MEIQTNSSQMIDLTLEEQPLSVGKVSDGCPSPVGMSPSKPPLGAEAPTPTVGGLLTPTQKKKQLAEQKAERDRVRAEAKAKREEEQQKKEEEKQLREQEKKEKQMKKEQELKKRQEKREHEELEKKERREKREADKKKKDDERKRKLEEKMKLEQEKEQLIEEKRRKENQAKMKFRGYFGKIEKPTAQKDITLNETILTAFSVKENMILAEAPRGHLQDTSEFDRLLKLQNPDYCSTYIQTCRSVTRKITPGRSTQNKAETLQKDDSVIFVPSAPERSLPRFKLLQFKENYRPAYFGSWRKHRGSINPRNPFKKDEGTLLDYEVDSDAEWEEEEPGESISSSEDEDKEGEGGGEDSDENDGFFVPHGYLSNDEGDCSDSGELPCGPGGDNPQDSKRCKQLAKAWEAEFARKCQPLVPKVIGCLWIQPAASSEEKALSEAESFLVQFAAVPLVALPISVASTGETTAESGTNAESTKQPVPEEAMPDLIRFIHKNSMGVNRIIKTFRTHWGAKSSTGSPHVVKTPLPNPPSQPNTISTPSRIDSTPRRTKTSSPFQEYERISGISKRQLEKKIQAIAMKETRVPVFRPVWYVHDAVLKQYGLDQENFAALSPSGSPTLSAKIPDHVSPSRTFISPDPPNQALKRRSNGVGKSLLQFLVRSPLDKPPQAPSAKRPKTETSAASYDDVIIVEPPPPPATLANEVLAEPLAKKPCLDGISGLAAISPNSNKMPADMSVLV